MTRREAYNLMRRGSVAGVELSASTAQEIAVLIYDAMRTAGEPLPDRIESYAAQGVVPPSLADLQVMARGRGCHVLTHEEWTDLQQRIESVSEGAQRDSLDLHKRLATLEKRLVPPNPDGSWALLTTPEATTAIERLETEMAELRNRMGADSDVRRDLRNMQGEINATRRGLAQLQQQFQNIRDKFKALLS